MTRTNPIRVESVASEISWHEGWESWCSEHPMPNGDTGVMFDRWDDALRHAFEHARTAHDFHASAGATS